MLLLKPEQIEILVERQRREFDEAALKELVDSISSNPAGLQNAVVVRNLPEQRYVLVSGERRLRAVVQLHFLGKSFYHAGTPVPAGLVPCISVGDLTPLQAEEAELDENIKRKDLTWQERANAVSRLAALRHGQVALAAASGDFAAQVAAERAATVAAIAAEVRSSGLGANQEATRREIIVAKHMDDPEVRAAKTLDEAFKVLKRKESAQQNVQLAATVGRTFSAALHRAEHTDCLSWLTGAVPDQFDCVVADPPYGIGANKFGDGGGAGVGAHFYDDSFESWQALMKPLPALLHRVCKAQAHLYLFCDIDRFTHLKEIFNAEGWQVFRTPLVWHKPTGSRLPWDFGPQRKYELVLYANKGRRSTTRIYPDVVSCSPDENIGHPAQKPVAVYVDLLRRCVNPGDKVLDFCAGSGPIFPAAHELKCAAVGLELDAGAYGLCLKRLKALKAQGELPV